MFFEKNETFFVKTEQCALATQVANVMFRHDGARQSGKSCPTPLELQSLTNSEPASKVQH